MIVVTIQGSNWTILGGNQAERAATVAAVNDAIQAKTTGHDETADTTGTPIGEAQDGSNTTYYVDTVHLKGAGHAYVAQAVETALAALGVT